MTGEEPDDEPGAAANREVEGDLPAGGDVPSEADRPLLGSITEDPDRVPLADVRASAAEAAVAAAEKILTVSAKGKVAEDLIARGIEDVKSKLN